MRQLAWQKKQGKFLQIIIVFCVSAINSNIRAKQCEPSMWEPRKGHVCRLNFCRWNRCQEEVRQWWEGWEKGQFSLQLLHSVRNAGHKELHIFPGLWFHEKLSSPKHWPVVLLCHRSRTVPSAVLKNLCQATSILFSNKNWCCYAPLPHFLSWIIVLVQIITQPYK